MIYNITMQKSPNQYSSVSTQGNNILYRGYNKKTRNRVQEKIQYSPTLFIKSNNNIETGYKLVTNKSINLTPIKYETISEANAAIYFNRQLDQEQRQEYHGNRTYEYAYLSDIGEADNDNPNLSLIRIANIDIEVISDTPDAPFPEPEYAPTPVVSITVRTNNKFVVFGFKETYIVNDTETVVYVKCDNELDLLNKFLLFWKKYDPDIVTGWNIRSFDIPYLVNRISSQLGKDRSKELSPWNIIREVKAKDKFREYTSYNLVGIEMIDYMYIYQKIPHANASQESYSLNHIAYVELDEAKLNYDEYGTLRNLYLNDFQKFIDYNIKDVDIVHRLEQKLKFINLIINTAYDAGVNFSDFVSQIAMVDNIVFKRARQDNLVIPARKDIHKDTPFTGAAVADTQVGKYKWIVSYDLTSLYPHVQMEYNISPETLIPNLYTGKPDIDSLVENGLDIKTKQRAIDNNCSFAANGHYFTNDFVGIFPEIQNRMFADRKKYSAAITKLEEILSNGNISEETKTKIELEITRFDNAQLSKKVQLNSIYGALGSQYCRFFDTRLSEAITLGGQLSIKTAIYNINKFLNSEVGKTDINFLIASDTDSVILNLGPIVDIHFSREQQTNNKNDIVDFLNNYCKTKLDEVINDCYNNLAAEMNCMENKMHMKREKIAEIGLFTGKKRYALLINDEKGFRYKPKPKLKIVGLETRRSSTPELVRDKLEQLIFLCLNESNSSVIKFIDEFKAEFFAGKYAPEEISTNSTANFAEYKLENGKFTNKTPEHIRGALFHNSLIRELKLDKKIKLIPPGEKIKVIKLLEPNPYNIKVFAFVDSIPQELKILEQFIDYGAQFEKIFLKPASSIMEACGYTTKVVRSLI